MTPAPMPLVGQGARRLWVLAIGLGALLLAFAVVLVAWIGDDAQITFRTIENLLAGHGLRWNVSERVQTFTHPLWLFVLTLGRVLVGDCYWAALLLGGLATLVAATLLARLAGWRGAGPLLVVLALSRFFVDYATSGLETGLNYALLATLAWLWLRRDPDRPRHGAVALVCGLMLTNRLDLAPLLLPMLLQTVWVLGPRRSLQVVLPGMLPLLGWLAFAAIYYGSILPATAYAKVGHGLPAARMALQGLHYAWLLLLDDPVTATAIVAGLALGAFDRRPGRRTLAVAIALHLGYVIAVGGDFMAGRFFLPTYVLAIALCADSMSRLSARTVWMVPTGALLLASLAGLPTCFGGHREDPGLDISGMPWGIGDERRYYYTVSGMLSPHLFVPPAGLLSRELRARGDVRPRIQVWSVVGGQGYVTGDLMHIVDPLLCDPLLVRLPVARGSAWRIGHFPRRIPDGYLESIATGTNRIRNPALARYYDALRLITEAPVLAPARLRALWDQWLGRHDADLQEYVEQDYQAARPQQFEVGDLDAPIAPGTLWNLTKTARAIGAAGAILHVTSAQAPVALDLLVDGGDSYTFEFCRGDEVVGRQAAKSPTATYEGMADIRVPSPAAPFDRVRIGVTPGIDLIAALGWLRLE